MSAGRASGRLVLVTAARDTDPHPLARGVAAHLDRAVHVDLHALRNLVVSGAAATQPPDPAAVEQLYLRWLGGIAVAETYQRAGFDAVLSESVDGELLDDLLDFVDPSPVHLVVLEDTGSAPPAAVRTGHPRGLHLDVGAGPPVRLVDVVVQRLDEALVNGTRTR